MTSNFSELKIIKRHVDTLFINILCGRFKFLDP